MMRISQRTCCYDIWHDRIFPNSPLREFLKKMMRISLITCCCYDICHDSSLFKRIFQTMIRISLRSCCCHDICHDSSLEENFSNNDENITKNLLLLWYLTWQFPCNRIFQTMMRISLRTCLLLWYLSWQFPF